MADKPAWFYTQSAAVPVRPAPFGFEVLLVTNRSRTRWIVPKGIVEPDLTPAESAAKEAWEEAGVRGTLAPEPIGAYRYEKWGGTCEVEVFLLWVDEVAEDWPEDERRRRWLGAKKAARTVDEPGLREILRRVPALAAGEEP